MLRPFLRPVVRVLLLPLLLLFSGVQTGAWHCADGEPCDASTVLTCCCGCPEGADAGPTQDALASGTSADECGCYYHSGELSSVHSAGAGFHATLPPVQFPLALPDRGLSTALTNSEEGGPPGHLVSPRNTRGPPSNS